MTRLSHWAIPGRVWTILLSWGMAVLLMATLVSVWVWTNQREQDQDMCAMIATFLDAPEPAAGPEGDRSRAVLAAMREYYEKRDCPGG